MKRKAAAQNNIQILLSSSFFWMFFGMLLVIGGVHTGLFCLLAVLQVSPLMQTHLILLYWLLVATLLS